MPLVNAPIGLPVTCTQRFTHKSPDSPRWRGVRPLLWLCCWLCALISVAGAAGAEGAPLQSTSLAGFSGQDRVSLLPFMTYLEDEHALSVEAVLQQPDAVWQHNAAGRANFGQMTHPLWIRVQLTAVNQLADTTYVRLAYPHLDHLTLYVIHDNTIIRTFHGGDLVPFDTRAEPHRHYLFPLDGLDVPTVTLLLRAESQGPIDLPLEVLTAAAFYHQEALDMAWYGGYFGIMLMMFFYNFIIYVLVRDVTYFYYLFYVAATTALQFTLTGAGFQYLWPDSAGFNNTIILMLTAFMPLSAIAFVRSFLGLEQNGRAYERWMARGLMAGFAVVFLGALLAPYMLVLKVAHGLSFVAVSMGFYLGVAFWMRGVKAARIFALAWFVYLVFIIVYLLHITGNLPSNRITIHSLEIGSVLELVLLSLSFGYRVNEEKEMRIVAQEQALTVQTQLNERLDQLVQQRTKELEAANQKLTELSIRDGLTGVYNRRHFDDMLRIEYQRAFRDRTWLCVALLDVDHFKSLNDTYGHAFGDECLKAITGAVAGAINRPPDLLARYGGEEFVLLLPGASPEGGQVVAENVRLAVSQLALSHGAESVSLTISVGVVSVVPAQREGHEQLTQRADESLYQAKSQGRNRVVLASD